MGRHPMSNGYLRNVSFLVVDDCDFTRRVSAQILRCFGAEDIYEAFDGEDAKHQVADHNPDIVLTDWMMKPMDGIQFTRWTRTGSDTPDPFLPIVMMSSYSDADRVLEARDAGVNEFLVKPMTPKGLMKRLQSVIEKPRPFVRTDGYFGPDRRRRDLPYRGPDRRAAY